MPRSAPETLRYDSLRASGRALARLAPWVRFGLFSVGLSMFLDECRSLVSDAQFTWGERRIMGIVGLSYLGGFGLAAWASGRLIATGAGLIDVFIDQAESSSRTAELIERHAIPALGRIALALEKLPAPPVATSPDLEDDGRERSAKVARQAIASGRWAQAEKLVGRFVREHPGPDAARLLAELEDARNREVDRLKTRLDAARGSGDALLAVEIRDALTEHLRGDRLDELDRDLVRWLVAEVKRRARSGPIRPEVATLAARVADSFADTPEGEALRASIPNLRRSAGLCPRCARPFRGTEDACPRCLARDPSNLPSRTRQHPVGLGRLRGTPMSLRLRCRSCQAAFVTSKDQVGQPVECPKCGASQVVPRPRPVADPSTIDDPPLQRMKAPTAPAAPNGRPVVGLHPVGPVEGDEGAGEQGDLGRDAPDPPAAGGRLRRLAGPPRLARPPAQDGRRRGGV